MRSQKASGRPEASGGQSGGANVVFGKVSSGCADLRPNSSNAQGPAAEVASRVEVE